MRYRPRLTNGLRRCDEGIGYRDDSVSFVNAGSHQSKAQAVRPTVHTDAMLHAAEFCERSFELLNEWSSNRYAGPEDFLKYQKEIIFLFPVRDGKIDKWETYDGDHLASVAFDTLHRGTPDRRLKYGIDGTARLEVDPAGDGHFKAAAESRAARQSR